MPSIKSEDGRPMRLRGKRRWPYENVPDSSDAAPASSGLMPITVTVEETSKTMLEVVLPNRLTLRVPLSAEPSQVTRWAQVLGSC